MDINSEEQVNTDENLTNRKPWFNGMKSFSSVKVQPVQDEESAPPLGIAVGENVGTLDRGPGG